MNNHRSGRWVRVALVTLGVLASVVIPSTAAFAVVEPGSCSSRVSGDFDADGTSDLAVGVPGQEIDGANAAGAVHIFYGDTTTGIDGSRDDVITQDSGGVDDGSEAGDRFGSCLAAADYNGDGESDLAIAVPGENVGAIPDAGAINVIYGTDDGLDAIGPPTDDFIHQNSVGPNGARIGGASEDGDRFGSALAAGDFDGDGRDDLAVGAPYDDIVDIVDAGAINVIYGISGGLTATGNQLLFQNSKEMAESSERRDEFGSSLAAGDLNGSGEFDLAIGVPGESVGSKARAGAVQVIYSGGNKLNPNTDVLWHQARAGVVGDGATALDRFGSSVAIGDFDGDGFGDLACGVPAEGVGADAEAGAVNVFYGSDTGINASGDQFITQDTSAGVTLDSSEPGDRFGTSLSAADYEDDGEGDDDLTIGAPGEDTVGGTSAGVAIVLYGDDPSGLDAVNGVLFSQDNPATMDDTEEANDRFGAALVSGDYNGDGIFDVVFGAPGEDIGGEDEAGAVSVVYGNTGGLDPAGVLPDLFLDQDSSGDDASEEDDAFGASLG